MSHDIAGQYVYCNPPWSLEPQSVEHIRTYHAKSPRNTKAVIVLIIQNWPQFNAAASGLRFMRQVHTNTPEFTKPSPLGKKHPVVKFSWPIHYSVIDTETFVKMSPTIVKSVASSFNVER